MVSTYNATQSQCGKDPHINSAGNRPKPGDAGISPALRKALGLTWGDLVLSTSHGLFEITDHTNKRFRRTVDLLILSSEAHFREEQVVTFIKLGCILKSKPR